MVRLADDNGYMSPSVVTGYAGVGDCGRFNLQRSLEGLSRISGVAIEALNAIKYVKENANGRNCLTLLGHDLANGVTNKYLRLKQRAFCPSCVSELGYIEAFWDLSVAIACPRHGTLAVTQCECCGKKVNWLRPGLKVCRCGAHLDQQAGTAVEPNLKELLTVIRNRLHNEPSIDTSAGFPLEDLNRMTLGTLLYLVCKLGAFANPREGPKRRGGSEPMGNLLSAANALARWPDGIHSFLDSLGARFQNEHGSYVGLRRQFQPFYQTFFLRRRYKNELGFLRTEFLRFGADEWGRAIIDRKLYRNDTVTKTERFISVAEAAKRLSVSPATVRKWCIAGKIRCKKRALRSGARYVIDGNHVTELRRKPGERMQERKAAAIVGIPVAVLRELKQNGDYEVRSLPTLMSGYHERDLRAFRKRIDKAAEVVVISELQGNDQLTLEQVLKASTWWVASAKAEFLMSYLEGAIHPAGKCSTNPFSVFFSGSQVEQFINRDARDTSSVAMTPGHAADRLGCSAECVKALSEKGYLKTRSDVGYRIICAKSVRRFEMRYQAINSLAWSASTTARKLCRIADAIGVDLLPVSVAERYVTTFLPRGAETWVLDRLGAERRAKMERANREPKVVRDSERVSVYLRRLRESNEPLPRRKSRPNLVAIAKACGVHRNVFYEIREIAELLDDYAGEDAKRFGVSTESDLAHLEAYLERQSKTEMGLPKNNRGKPHKVRMARDAGVARSVFYANTGGDRLLARYSFA